MINFRQKFLLVVLLFGNLSFSPLLFAQDSVSPPLNSTIKGLEAQVEKLKIQNEELKKQNDILNKQLEHMREFDGRILDTVWWALSILGALGLAIAAFSWWTYKSDKEELKNLIIKDLNDFKEQLKDRTKEPYISIKQASIEEATISASEIAKEFFNNNVEDNLKQIDQQVSSINRTLRELSTIKYGLNNLQAKQYESEGIFDNALRRYLDMIDFAVELESETWVEDTLDAIQKIVEKPRNLSDNDLLSDIKQKLENLPQEYQHLVQIDTLKTLLSSASA
jgi:prefoldin subunit 5